MTRDLEHVPAGVDPERLVPVPDLLLRTLLDIAVSSLDFGSGFWDQEDIDAARAVASLLNVCPQAATPGDMRGKYPDCGHLRSRPYEASWREHEAHEMEG